MSISEVLPYDLRYIRPGNKPKRKKGWTDITPIAQDDPPNAVVAISYEPEYRHAMDAFRYILSVQEKSQRAIDLTGTIIQKNAGMFTVWNYRSMLLTTLPGQSLSAELDFMESMMKVHLKGYQVWQHRRIIVLAMDDPSRELDFCSRVLQIDAKNYHTWQYRHWVLCHFYGPTSQCDDKVRQETWDGELRYCEGLLADDIRNNSAWAHRFFCCFESGVYIDQQDAVAQREIDFSWEKLKIVSDNPSAWNYLRGVLRRAHKSLSSYLPQVEALPKAMLTALAVEFMADSYAEECRQSADTEKQQRALELYDLLVNDLDPIRSSFYAYRKSRLSANQS